MKAHWVLSASVFLVCTLEILGNPVRNLRNDESALNKRLLQIHLALAEDDENDLKQQKLSELVDDELLSYIEEHKEKFEELGAKEVRSSKLGGLKCKGKEPTTTKPKTEPPKKIKPPKWHVFPGFNVPPNVNTDCLLGDILLTPEECLVLKKKLHHS